MDISTAIESEALKKSYQGASELALPLVSHIRVGCTPSAALIRRSGVGVSKFDRIINISFAIRQFEMNPTKPSFDMTILYSYRDECTLNTNQLQCRFVIKIQPKILTASHQRTETVCPPLVAPTLLHFIFSTHACVLTQRHHNPPPTATYSPKGQARHNIHS